jgi:hypothetical protein
LTVPGGHVQFGWLPTIPFGQGSAQSVGGG